MRISVLSSFLLASLLVLPTGRAQDQPGSESLDEPIRSAAECPALFGGQSSLERNQKYRSERLDEVIVGEHLVNLVYYGDWLPPQKIRFQGMDLLAAGGADAIGPHALVQIDKMPAGIACPTGRYLLRPDHSIGAGTQVLAIVEDAALLAHKGQLRFLTVARKTDPDFRLIWRSTWTVAGTQPAGSPAAPAASSRVSPGVKSTRTKPGQRRPPTRP